MISINGVSYQGNNLTIINGKVMIDGKDMTPDAKEITINVNGNVASLSVDNARLVKVSGVAGNLSTVSGDVEVGGSVHGSVSTVSGDVDCGEISGSVKTVSGDIKQRR